MNFIRTYNITSKRKHERGIESFISKGWSRGFNRCENSVSELKILNLKLRFLNRNYISGKIRKIKKDPNIRI